MTSTGAATLRVRAGLIMPDSIQQVELHNLGLEEEEADEGCSKFKSLAKGVYYSTQWSRNVVILSQGNTFGFVVIFKGYKVTCRDLPHIKFLFDTHTHTH